MLTLSYTIDDADIESGISQALDSHNATLDSPLTAEQFVTAAFDATLEAYRGSAKRALLAKAETLDYADLADLVPAIDAKVAAKVISVQPSPAVVVKP